MACASLTMLLLPTMTPRGAKSVIFRLFVVKISPAVLTSKGQTVQHGLRYSNNASGAHNDAARCQVGQLSTLRGENLGGGFGLESENCPAWAADRKNAVEGQNEAAGGQGGQLSNLRGGNLGGGF